MKRLVKVSVSDLLKTYTSSSYIDEYSDYNIKCTVVSQNYGILKDTYILRLEGDAENIQMFLDYLKYEKFRIH